MLLLSSGVGMLGHVLRMVLGTVLGILFPGHDRRHAGTVIIGEELAIEPKHVPHVVERETAEHHEVIEALAVDGSITDSLRRYRLISPNLEDLVETLVSVDFDPVLDSFLGIAVRHLVTFPLVPAMGICGMAYHFFCLFVNSYSYIFGDNF